MRNPTLHGILREFTADSAMQFTAATADGAEIPFEIIETDGGRGRVPLYCYRPLTASFIRERLGLLAHLPSYAAAWRALAELPGSDVYLRQRGEQQIPSSGRARAEVVLRSLLARVFEERSEFGLDDERFEMAYEELERALYDGQFVTTVIVPLLGLALDPNTTELALGDGLSVMPGSALDDAPTEAVWPHGMPDGPDGRGAEPNALLVFTTSHERASNPQISQARERFRKVLTALRLFERGGYAVGPIMWTRVSSAPPSPWQPLPFGPSGRAGADRLTLIPVAQEDELRAFCNLISRRIGGLSQFVGHGELAWALRRFELGCDRASAYEALTDYLLALRALLEPEGPSSGRLAQRLAVICATPDDRPALAERIAHTISLERAVIAGLAPDGADAERLVNELSEHLRALLRDVLCGHLDADLCEVADELLDEAATSLPERLS